MPCGDPEGWTVCACSFPSLNLPTQSRPSPCLGEEWVRGWERPGSSLRRSSHKASVEQEEAPTPPAGQAADGANLSEIPNLYFFWIYGTIGLHFYVLSISWHVYLYDTSMPFVGYRVLFYSFKWFEIYSFVFPFISYLWYNWWEVRSKTASQLEHFLKETPHCFVSWEYV